MFTNRLIIDYNAEMYARTFIKLTIKQFKRNTAAANIKFNPLLPVVAYYMYMYTIVYVCVYVCMCALKYPFICECCALHDAHWRLPIAKRRRATYSPLAQPLTLNCTNQIRKQWRAPAHQRTLNPIHINFTAEE